MKKLKLTICLCCVMLAAGINSCKKELTNPFGTANNSTALALTQLSSGQKIQASEMFTWFQSVSPYLKIKPLWDKAEQTVLNGDQVIMVPINNHTALFFTKVNGILNVSAYKWSGKKPVDAKFSGKVAAFSFQSYSFKAYVFKKGKVVKFDTLSLVSTFQPTSSGVSVSGKSVSGTKTLSSTGETTTTVVSQLSHPSINRPKNLSLFGNIFNDIGCWLQGGSVIPGDEDGCYIVEGDSLWDRIAGFFANLFGVGDNVGTPNDNTQNWTTGVITDPDGSTGEVTTSSTEGVYIIVNSPCNTGGMPPPAGPPQDPNSPPDPGDGGGDSGDPCVSTNTQWIPIPIAQQLEIALENELDVNPFLLIRCDVLQKFKDLESITPPQSVITRMNNLNIASGDPFMNQYYVQNIKTAVGWAINLDRFEINVTTLPVINGVRDPSVFLEYIRVNLNQFIDNSITTFQPYVDPSHNIDDTNLWLSADPTTAFLHLNIYGPIGTGDNGSVVVDDHTSSHWTVSTIRTPIDGNHPVTGNRQWGYDTNPDGTYTFFVTGADRITRPFSQLAQTLFSNPFNRADNLWESYQSGIETFVNNHGGSAVKNPTPTTLRPDFQALTDYFNETISLTQFKANHGCQ